MVSLVLVPLTVRSYPMTPPRFTQQEQLRNLEVWIARNVWDVNGTVTPGEIDKLYELRRATGLTYDAVNGVFRPWFPDPAFDR